MKFLLNSLMCLTIFLGGFISPANGQNNAASKKDISGTVIDTQGDPVIGAYVIIKGIKTGTATDENGKFNIKASSNDILQVSFIGMDTKEQKIGNKNNFKIILEDSKIGLEEVVVVGYATQQKVNLTGSVAMVKATELESRPVASISQALEGMVPGLNFLENEAGGELGNSMTTNIRGVGTIGEGSQNQTLVLIDGIQGDMNTLNPEDIESISVLKDAASAAVYGSRAPFGVILITTKKGVRGKAKITYSNNFRWSSPTNTPQQLNAYNFAQFINEAERNGGSQTPVFKDSDLEILLRVVAGDTIAICKNQGNNPPKFGANQNGYSNNDWNKIHWMENSFSQQHNLNISGGNESTTYYVSGSMLSQGGLLRYGKDQLNRFTLNANIESKVRKWLLLTVNSKIINEVIDKPTFADALLYHDILRMWPTTPLINPDGRYSENSRVIQLTEGGRMENKRNWYYNTVTLKFSPVNNFDIIAKASIRSDYYKQKKHVAPLYSYDINGEPYPFKFRDEFEIETSRISNNFLNRHLLQPEIFGTYTFEPIKSHQFNILGGFTCEKMITEGIKATRTGLITNSMPNMSVALGDIIDFFNEETNWATAGVFGRINYNYKSRYLLEMNMRYDGSSRFRKDMRWNVFPSASFGWNITKERFMEDISWIEELKPRASWGMLGNQNSNNLYPYINQMPIEQSGGNWITGSSKPTISYSPDPISYDLTWEKIKSTNIGVDISMFNSRLKTNFDWFSRTTDDMIGPAEQLPESFGAKIPRRNNASLRTRGWELIIGWRDSYKDFSYSATFNLSDQLTKVVSYPNPSKLLSNSYYPGATIGDIWGFETYGIAKSDAEMNQWLAHTDQSLIGSYWQAGDIMYIDRNKDGVISTGDGTVDNPGDMKKIGNSTPRYNFGLRLTAGWKGFDISVLFQGVGKRDIAATGPFFWGAYAGSNSNGTGGGKWQAAGFVDHWDFFRSEDNPLGANLDSYYPRPIYDAAGYKNQMIQTRYLQNGAYMRLKNIQIGYKLPVKMMKSIGISQMRIFFSGENLWTLKKIRIYDPQSANNSSYGSGKVYPLMQTTSCGVNLTF